MALLPLEVLVSQHSTSECCVKQEKEGDQNRHRITNISEECFIVYTHVLTFCLLMLLHRWAREERWGKDRRWQFRKCRHRSEAGEWYQLYLKLFWTPGEVVSKYLVRFIQLAWILAKNTAFCFCCRVFSKQEKRANKDGLAPIGYGNWKRALDSLREHEKMVLHRASMTAWVGYQATKVHGDVTEQIVASSAAEITERREYLHRIVSVMIFLAKQGIAFRGHCKGDDSPNQPSLNALNSWQNVIPSCKSIVLLLIPPIFHRPPKINLSSVPRHCSHQG